MGKKKAVIWVPGFSAGLSFDQSVTGLAYRIAQAGKNNDVDYVVDSRDEIYSGEGTEKVTTKVCTLSTLDDQRNKVPSLDIWAFEWETMLVAPISKFSLGKKALNLLLVLISGFFRTARTFSTRGLLGTRERVQLLYAISVLGIIAAAMLFALSSVVAAVVNDIKPGTIQPGNVSQAPESRDQAVLKSTDPAAGPSRETLDSNSPSIKESAPVNAESIASQLSLPERVWQTIKDSPGKLWTSTKSKAKRHYNLLKEKKALIIAALLAVFVLSSQDIRRWFDQATSEIVAAYLYLSWDWNGELILGRLELLVATLGDMDYEEIEIIGCSMGSIYALNYLFPAKKIETTTREKIVRLTTIGCPHDFVSSYWPGYFERRYKKVHPQFQWLNIYCLTDIFGSNFLTSDPEPTPAGLSLVSSPADTSPYLRPDQNKEFSPTHNVSSSIIDILVLMGIKNHAVYWGASYQGEANCLDPYYRFALMKPVLPMDASGIGS